MGDIPLPNGEWPTLLQVEEHRCSNCDCTWTSSRIVTTYGVAIEHANQPMPSRDSVTGWVFKKMKLIPMCHSCLIVGEGKLKTYKQTEPSLNREKKPKPEATPLDLFGD